MKALDNKITLLNGAIGECALAIAKLVLDQGGSVILLDSPGDELNKTYDALAESFGLDESSERLAIYPLGPEDTDKARCDKLAVDLTGSYPGVDIVVHNRAALCPPQGLDELGFDDWALCFGHNVHMPWMIQRALVYAQAKRQRGRVVFIVDELDEPWLGAYALSKTAQIHLMRAWAREFQPERRAGDPVVAAVSVKDISTEARRYYFPGLGDNAFAGVSAINKALMRAFLDDAGSVHGKVLVPDSAGQGTAGEKDGE